MTYTKVSIILKDRPPYFIGSQIRGGFGHALKKVTCINPSYNCDGCFATSNCLYHEFYEEKNIFHKYRLNFDLGSELYNFDFYLFDSAIPKLPYVVSAFHMLLTQIGLGKEKKTYNNFDMFINDENCFINSKLLLPQNFTKTFQIDNFCPNIILEFVTQLRIKKDNVYIRNNEIALDDIVNSIYQRQMKLLGREFKKFPYQIRGDIASKDLVFKELSRYSNRQKTDMKLGGIVGTMEIKNLSIETYNILKVGELIGVGKSTVFGLGKIRIKSTGGNSE